MIYRPLYQCLVCRVFQLVCQNFPLVSRYHSSICTTVKMYHPQHKQPAIEWNQVLLNDRDPVRWYESVKNTILNVVTLFSNPIVAYNPLLQLLLVLTGRTAMQVVPKVLSLWNAIQYWWYKESLPPFNLPHTVKKSVHTANPPLSKIWFRQFATPQHLWVQPFLAACLELLRMVRRKLFASLRPGRLRWGSYCITYKRGVWKLAGNPIVHFQYTHFMNGKIRW